MAKQVAAMSGLQPYPAYKTSGVEWLGDVPAHWQMERAKWLFRKMERPVRDRDDVVTCFRDGKVTLRKNRRTDGFTESLKEIGYQGVRVGDLVIHAMDAFAGAVGVSDADGKSTPVYSVCTPMNENVSPSYYAPCIREMARNDWILALSKGIRERSTDFRFLLFASQLLPWPPLPEQAAIARYLDHADRRIRRCIHAKEKLVRLLEEQKQAEIHRAVTGRVDVRTGQPYAAYKPSGVKWLGEVPAHWEVQKLGRMGTLSKGNGGSKADEEPVGVPCVRYGDLYTTHTRFIRSSRAFVSQVRAADYTPLKHGDVLFAASGETIDEIGRSAVNLISSGACCGGDIIVFRPKGRTHAPFMGYVTDCWSSVIQKATMGRGFTVVHIYATQLKQLVLPVPPLSEQAAIARYLDHADQRVQCRIQSAKQQTDLLEEYRTRLMADVVTGKLDVRKVAAQLPDGIEQTERSTESDAPSKVDPSPADSLGAAAWESET